MEKKMAYVYVVENTFDKEGPFNVDVMLNGNEYTVFRSPDEDSAIKFSKKFMYDLEMELNGL